MVWFIVYARFKNYVGKKPVEKNVVCFFLVIETIPLEPIEGTKDKFMNLLELMY